MTPSHLFFQLPEGICYFILCPRAISCTWICVHPSLCTISHRQQCVYTPTYTLFLSVSMEISPYQKQELPQPRLLPMIFLSDFLLVGVPGHHLSTSSLSLLFDTGSLCDTLDALKLEILWPKHSVCWNYRFRLKIFTISFSLSSHITSTFTGLERCLSG